MRNGEQVKHAADRMVDHFCNRFWTLVKARQRREDDAAHFGDGSHVAQVRQIERRFTHHQYQPAALFQNHIGGAGD